LSGEIKLQIVLNLHFEICLEKKLEKEKWISLPPISLSQIRPAGSLFPRGLVSQPAQLAAWLFFFPPLGPKPSTGSVAPHRSAWPSRMSAHVAPRAAPRVFPPTR